MVLSESLMEKRSYVSVKFNLNNTGLLRKKQRICLKTGVEVSFAGMLMLENVSQLL